MCLINEGSLPVSRVTFPGQGALGAEGGGLLAPSCPLKCTREVCAAFLSCWWSDLETDPAAGASVREALRANGKQQVSF